MVGGLHGRAKECIDSQKIFGVNKLGALILTVDYDESLRALMKFDPTQTPQLPVAASPAAPMKFITFSLKRGRESVGVCIDGGLPNWRDLVLVSIPMDAQPQEGLKMLDIIKQRIQDSCTTPTWKKDL